MTFDGIFRDRSVFITGHTGFKGSWLALWLHRLGARVSGYSLAPPSSPNNFEASGVRGFLERHYEADVRDADRLQAAMEASQPSLVFHLAAQTLVRQSYLEPRQTFDVNVTGTASLLDAVRSLRRPCAVIVVTSDKCYENHANAGSHRESDPLGGRDPYSASKAAAEVLAASYRHSFFPPEKLAEHGVKVASVRAGNCIGGGDWATDRIIPDVARALSSNQDVPVRNPDSIRPWQHVLEPLSGYLTLASLMLSSDDPGFCSGWNFGPHENKEAAVRDLVELFCHYWGGGSWSDARDSSQPNEEAVLRLCIEKAMTGLGWRPRWSFEETVERTCRWYQSYYAAPRKSAYGLCEGDIAGYEAAEIDACRDPAPQRPYAHAK